MLNFDKALPALAKKAGLGPFSVFSYIAAIFTGGAAYWLNKSGKMPHSGDVEQLIGFLVAVMLVYVALGFYVRHIFSKADQD